MTTKTNPTPEPAAEPPRFTLQRSLAIVDKLDAHITQAVPSASRAERRAITEHFIMNRLIDVAEVNRLVEHETGIGLDGTEDWCPGASCGTAWVHVHGGDCTSSCIEGGCA